MRIIKRLITSVLVASMLMQFAPISDLSVRAYAKEADYELETFKEETSEDIVVPESEVALNDEKLIEESEAEDGVESIEEPIGESADADELTEEAEGEDELDAPTVQSAGEGAVAGKYVVTLQPIQTGSSDYYELSFKIFNGESKIYDSGNLCSNIVDDESKWSDIFTHVELNEDPTDIQIVMRYKPNAGDEGDTYEDLIYESSFPKSCKDVMASAKLQIQYPDWAAVDFCKYSIESTEGTGDLYYIDADGKEQVRHEGEYEVFRGVFGTKSSQEEAWYAVTEDISVQELLVIGKVHLVLCDETKLDVYQAGIEVFKGSSLTIYAQERSSGVLNSRGNYVYEPFLARAGIGGEGDITINGGHITAIGGCYLPGIGGDGCITINGGKDGSRTYVNAQGGVIDHGKASKIPNLGPGIGQRSKKITINGGSVEAIGGNHAVGIGGFGGDIYINGGNVYAFTPKNALPNEAPNGAAAIGAGHGGSKDFDIIITGGYVEAISEECGAGIGGSGENMEGFANGGIITISGEDTEVYAASCYGAGIGSGGADVGLNAGKGASGDGMEITIKDGAYVYGVSLAGGAGIGGGVRSDGGHIVIDNATVIAQGGASHIPGWTGDLNPSFKKIRFDGLNVLEGYIDEALASVLAELIFSEDVSGAGIGGGAGAQTGYVEIKNGARVEAQSGYMTCNAIGKGNNVKDESYSDRDIYEMAKVTYGEYNSDNKTIKIIGENKEASSAESGWLSRNYRYVLIEPADLEFNFDLGTDDEGRYIMITAGTGTLSTVFVSSGDTVDRPEDPVYKGPDKTKAYIFDDWYEDEEFTKPFDFNKPINKDTKIYARWIKAYPLSITMDWSDNQTPPEKVDISYVNKYKKYETSESPECTKEGTITLSADNNWTGTIPVADSSIVTLTESAIGYTAENWKIKYGDKELTLPSANDSEIGQALKLQSARLDIRDGSDWIKDALHNDHANLKVEITNKRQYTVLGDWGGPNTQKYMAGNVLQSFYWKEAIDHVYAVLQEKQGENWVTVDGPVKLGEDFNNWKGSLSYQTDGSKKYRVRELITDEEVETYGGTGRFVFSDGVEADGHKEKILYAPGDPEYTGASNPVISFEFKPNNSNTPVTGAFSVNYEDLDENGYFKIINRKVSSFPVKMKWEPDTAEKPAPKPESIELALQHKENASADWVTVETMELNPQNNWQSSFDTTAEDEVDAKAHYRIVEKDKDGSIIENDGEAVHTVKCDGTSDREAIYVVSYDDRDVTGVTTVTNKPRLFAYEKIWGADSETADSPYKRTWSLLQYRSLEDAEWEMVDSADCKRGEVNTDSGSYEGVLQGWYKGQYRIREAAYSTGKGGAIEGEVVVAYADGDAEHPESGNKLIYRDDPYGSGAELHAYKVTYEQKDNKTIINSTQVSPFSVQKVWNDDGKLRPEWIYVALLELDTSDSDENYWNIVETQKLDESNSWSADFTYPAKCSGKTDELYCILELKPQGVGIVLDENDIRRGKDYYQVLVKNDIYYISNPGEPGVKKNAVNKEYSFTYTEDGKEPVVYKPSYKVDAKTGLTTITNSLVNDDKEPGCNEGNHDYVDGICSRDGVVSLKLCRDISIEVKNAVFNDAPQRPEVTVSYKGTVLTEDTDYILLTESKTAVGIYELTIEGIGNYGDLVERTWSILPAGGLYCDKIPDQTYTGKSIKPEIVVYCDGVRLIEGMNYTLSYKNNIKVNDASVVATAPTVTITGKGDYAKAATTNFKIVPKIIGDGEKCADGISVVIADKVYTGRLNESKPTVKFGNITLREKTDYDLIFSDDNDGSITKPGTVTVTITGKGNYDGSITTSYRIYNKAEDFSKLYFAPIADQTYTGEALEPEVIVKTAKTDVDAISSDDYDVRYENNVNAGTATAIITGKGIYAQHGNSKKVTFKIVPKAFTAENVLVELPDGNPSYTGTALKPIIKVIDKDILNAGAGDDAVISPDCYTVAYSNNTNVAAEGIADSKKPTIKITGKKNYKGTASTQFVINPIELISEGKEVADLSITVLDIKDSAKGITEKEVKPVIKYGKKTLSKGKDYTVAFTRDTLKQTHTAAITFCGNYSGSIDKKFVIYTAQKKATDLDVTLGQDTFTYTGQKIIPSVTVKTIIDDKEVTLVENRDYKVTAANNVNAADASARTAPNVKITGMGAYKGSSNVIKFTINKKELTKDDIIVTVDDAKFTKNAVRPKVTVIDKSTGKTFAAANYTVAYSNNVAIAEKGADGPKVLISGKGNYKTETALDYDFRIYQTAISGMVFDKIANVEYTGKQITPKGDDVKIYADKNKTTKLKEGEDYTLSYDTNIKAGAGKVTVTGMGEYGGSKTLTFTIVPKWLKWLLL